MVNAVGVRHEAVHTVHKNLEQFTTAETCRHQVSCNCTRIFVKRVVRLWVDRKLANMKNGQQSRTHDHPAAVQVGTLI